MKYERRVCFCVTQITDSFQSDLRQFVAFHFEPNPNALPPRSSPPFPSLSAPNMPIFATTLGSLSAHSFLSLSASTDASNSFSSSFVLTHKFPSKRPSNFAARVSLSGKPEPIAGVLESSPSSPESVRRARRSADWKTAREYLDSGFIFKGRIEGSNAGGLLVRFYSLVGFLPFPLLSPAHSCKEPYKSIQDIAKSLIGSLIPVKVIQADEKNKNLIFSEKEAAWSKFSEKVGVGDVYEARVGSVEDYGAFVHLRFSDGLYHLTGLVHISEVSWDLVQDVRDILSEGDEVRVKIIDVDRDKSRITLSIKQLEEDPLLETLDKVIPQDDSAEPDSFGPKSDSEIIPLPGLDTIFEELLQEEGIEDVHINRQGFEKRVVSQDLQLWLSNAPPVEKKFTLLARAGRQVQEIQLTTSLDQEGIKRALQRVLERVP